MIFIGDVHANFRRFRQIVEEIQLARPDETIVQIGDFGFGFGQPRDSYGNVRILRGNHDNPQVAAKHANYAGDFGAAINLDGSYAWVGGGYSIDYSMRTPTRDWWADEELSAAQFDNAKATILQAKDDTGGPDTMITHECPATVAKLVFAKHDLSGSISERTGEPRWIYHSRTARALEALRLQLIGRTKLWVFGHYHLPFDEVVEGTRFVCIPELQTFTPLHSMYDAVGQKAYLCNVV